jgi:uncharacterized membrane protein YccF (DUF307 family)
MLPLLPTCRLLTCRAIARVQMPSSTFATVGNLLWLPMGILLAVHHLAWGFMCFITIIGIPFSLQHLKLAQFSLWPFGAEVTPYTATSHTTLRTPFIV